MQEKVESTRTGCSKPHRVGLKAKVRGEDVQGGLEKKKKNTN